MTCELPSGHSVTRAEADIADTDIQPGTIVSGRFRVLAVLGRGAMGVVYRAEQLDHSGERLREVALKTIQPESLADPDLAAQLAARFLREVRISARLSSPNIVTVHDSGKTDDGQLYFAMELVRGDTLRDIILREAPLAVERAVAIACQICDALSEAHGGPEPIIHRDLKPANVFVQHRDGRDFVKVADFGIAKVLGEDTSGLTATGFSPGTPLFKAPEQWRGKDMDSRVDLYALGVILYEMLSGSPPFQGEVFELMFKHLQEPPPPLPPNIPASVRGVVERLLAKNPADRPATAATTRRLLEQALAGRLGEHDRTETPEVGATEVLSPPRETPPSRSAMSGLDASQAPAVESDRSPTGPDFSTPTSAQTAPRPRAAPALLWGALGVLTIALGAVIVLLLRNSPSRQPAPEPAGTRAPVTAKSLARGGTVSPATPAIAPAVPDAEAENRKRIQTLLAAAAGQFARKRFESPKGDNAVESWQQVLKLDAGNAEAVLGLEKVEKEYSAQAQAAGAKGDVAAAEAEYKKALEISPDSAEIQSALAGLAKRKAEASAAPASTAAPRAESRASAGAPMVTVPGGPFLMGCNQKVDAECFGNEKPGRTVTVSAFSIDKYEVSVADYRRCVDAGVCSAVGLEMPYWQKSNHPEGKENCNWNKVGRENHPINCIDWSQARAYCQWAGKRLPTEAEWEKAARGTDGRKYSWGSAAYGRAGRVANIADESAKKQFGWEIAVGYDDGFARTAPVGSFPAGASPYGALDMIGNVSEWMETRLGRGRAVRGGSWTNAPEVARASKRNWMDPTARNGGIGLRCGR